MNNSEKSTKDAQVEEQYTADRLLLKMRICVVF